MRAFTAGLGVLALVWAVSIGLARDDKDKADHGDGMKHVVVSLSGTKWGPAPPSLPPGAEAAVLDGDPRKAGSPYTIRVKMPDGYKVPPHWHPVDENVTVLKGALLMGKGDKFDPGMAEELTVGSFSHMPKGMRHFAQAKGETIIQVHGTGPFDITYVNPEDDPRKKAK